MESTSKAMKVQCSERTYQLLRDWHEFQFDFEKREVMVKGKGKKNTWWIHGVNATNSTDNVQAEESPVLPDIEKASHEDMSGRSTPVERKAKRVSFHSEDHEIIRSTEFVDADPFSEDVAPQ